MMISRILMVAVFVPFLFFAAYGQDSITDPVKKFSRFSETGYFLGYTLLNWNSSRELGETDFRYTGTTYFPNLEMYWNTGWILKKGQPNNGIVKTGFDFGFNSLNYKDTLNRKYQRSDGYLRIPLMLGSRRDINHSRVRGEMYRAIETYVGPYVTLPIYSSFQHNSYEFTIGKQIILGLEAELYLTSQNPKGYGHRYGIKVRADLYSFELSDQKFGPVPLTSTFGIFYNIGNQYVRKASTKEN